MKKSILVILLLLGLINATLDQSYQQIVLSNGTSIVSRTMDVEMVTGPLLPEHLNQIEIVCKQLTTEKCNFDKTTKGITITRSFGKNNEYYEVVDAEGFPLSSTTLTIKKIPTDKLGEDLLAILKQAGSPIQGGVPPVVDLNSDNKLSAKYMKDAKVNISYSINMPIGVASATAGTTVAQIEGTKAKFDIVEVMQQPRQITVVGKEINLVPMALIAGVLVLVAFAASFYMQEKTEAKKKSKKTQK